MRESVAGVSATGSGALGGAENWSNFFANTFAETLVKGFEVPEDGIDRDGPQVDRLLGAE